MHPTGAVVAQVVAIDPYRKLRIVSGAFRPKGLFWGDLPD